MTRKRRVPSTTDTACRTAQQPHTPSSARTQRVRSRDHCPSPLPRDPVPLSIRAHYRTDCKRPSGKRQLKTATSLETLSSHQPPRTAQISCQLASTTAATCTEYSSFGPNFTKGNTTGPTDFTRTQTYGDSDVEWGVLTLTSPAPAAATETGTSGNGVETINPADTAWFFPSPTSGTTSRAAPRVECPRGPDAAAAVVAAWAVWMLAEV